MGSSRSGIAAEAGAPAAGSGGTPRAWQVRRLGRPSEALAWVPVTRRAPGADEVRVAVEAAGCNFADLLVCAGRYQERPPLPFVPGFEGAGTVVEAGPGAGVAEGERVVVVAELPNGAFQEELTVPAAQVLPVPDDVPAETAAVLHIAYATAHAALHRRARLAPGETVLATGASGGVGSAVVQLARAAGHRVVGVVRGEAKAAAALRFGATDVIDLDTLDDGDGALAARVAALTDGRGADVVVDVAGGRTFDQLRRAVAFEGRLVVVGFAAGDIPTVPANHVLLRNYAVVGLYLARYRTADPGYLRDVHRELVALLRSGAITPGIHATMPMERLPEALALLAAREAVGRVVVRAGAGAPDRRA